MSDTNTLPNDADRYTIVRCYSGEVEKIIEAAQTLGLYWFALSGNSVMSDQKVWVHLFFDKQGCANYLKGLYDE